jgi:DNA gyrase inhibitor GyrI
LYRQFLTQREWHGIKPVAPEDTIREYEECYGKLMAWRQERGITPKEVAHVAVKWLDKKKAAGTSQ